MAHPLETYLHALPESPGVYLFKDRDGQLIYVGKAQNLRKRVRSYVSSRKHSPRTQALLQNVKDADWIAVDTPHEALLLEADLVRGHQPKYNVLLRDDKRYPWLRLSINEPYPTLHVVRRRARDGALYYGPYTSARAMRQTLQLIRLHLRLRKCKHKIEEGQPLPPDKGPCLYRQMDKCLGPCTGEVSPEIYGEVVEEVKEILSGRVAELAERTKREMRRCALEQRYEEAAQYRDKMAALVRVIERAATVRSAMDDEDLLGCVADADESVVVCLKVRDGALAGRDEMFLSGVGEAKQSEILEAYLMQRYGDGAFIPKRMVLPGPVPGALAIEEVLSQRAGRRVELMVPKKGERLGLLAMAQRNAWLLLSKRALMAEMEAISTENQLQARLGLDRKVESVDAMDVANMGGAIIVGATVRMAEGRPQKDGYRKFTLKGQPGPDDFGAMRHIAGRYIGLMNRGALAPPDLLLVDGGEGHRAAVAQVVADAGLSIPVVALAKGEEVLRGPSKGQQETLKPTDSDGRLLMAARDEAHRFAQAHLHLLASRGMRDSILDRIPDIGKARKKALLDAFGSVSGIRGASMEQLQRVPGIGPALAEQIKGHLAAYP